MKHYIHIAIIVAMLLASCANTKKVQRTESITKDSIATSTIQSEDGAVIRTRIRELRDTAIVIQYRSVADTLDELEPAYTADGTEVSRKHEAVTQGLRASITRLPGGKYVLECTADSLTVVVKGLQRSYDSLSDRYRQAQFIKTVTAHATEVIEEKETTKKQTFLQAALPWIVLIAIISAIVAVRKFL